MAEGVGVAINIHRSGQALIEVVVGLVAIMALLVGIVELTALLSAQSNTLIEARARAGASAMSDASISALPDYIAEIGVGADGRAYSVDDTHTIADQGALQSTVVDRTANEPTDWNTMDRLPFSPMSALRQTAVPVTEFGLVEGTAETRVTLLPGVQHLLYDAQEIDVRSRVWMTRTEGIY